MILQAAADATDPSSTATQRHQCTGAGSSMPAAELTQHKASAARPVPAPKHESTPRQLRAPLTPSPLPAPAKSPSTARPPFPCAPANPPLSSLLSTDSALGRLLSSTPSTSLGDTLAGLPQRMPSPGPPTGRGALAEVLRTSASAPGRPSQSSFSLPAASSESCDRGTPRKRLREHRSEGHQAKRASSPAQA